MEEETPTYKSIGFMFGHFSKKQWRVHFLVMPTTSGSLKEIIDDIQSVYLELEGCQLIGIAQRTCDDLKLCEESKNMYCHLVNTVAAHAVFLICKINGCSVLDPAEKWTALYGIVDGTPQQVSMNFITRREKLEEHAFKILTTRRLGKSEGEDVRNNIRQSLLKQAMGIKSDSATDTVIIADDFPVPLGDPQAYHPDDDMYYEIQVPPDGSCFLHAQQARLDPFSWLTAKRSVAGFAIDPERVLLSLA